MPDSTLEERTSRVDNPRPAVPELAPPTTPPGAPQLSNPEPRKIADDVLNAARPSSAAVAHHAHR